MEEDFHDPCGDHVQMYVLARENFVNFLTYMEHNHPHEIMPPDLSLKTAVFKEMERQQNEKHEEKNRENEKNSCRRSS
jgi:AMMECR1 domain-containing protein